MAAAQLKIRQNMEEYRDFVDELSSWQKTMKQKDEVARKSMPPVSVKNVPPVRGSSTLSCDAKPDPASLPAPPPTGTKADTVKPTAPRIKSGDYRSWDKFDVDKAIEDIDLESSFGKDGVKALKQEYGLAEQTRALEREEERLEKALLEKEKGNAYFKRGNYAKAVSHYTKSMGLDPRNAVLPINRAMAYLKLEKWLAAEEDCTRGLALDPKNVKAMWRRGIARREAGKLNLSCGDLEKALVLDPGNKAIREELEKTKLAANPPKAVSSARRRVPIEEVDTDSETETKEEEIRRKKKIAKPVTVSKTENISEMVDMRPIKVKKSSALKVPAEPVSAPAPQDIPARPVENEIGKNAPARDDMPRPLPKTIAEPSPNKSPADAPPLSKLAQPVTTVTDTKPKRPTFTPPKTSFDFDRDWKSFKRDDEFLFSYLECIPPAEFPSIFKSSLESDYLAKMLDIMAKFYVGRKTADETFDLLRNLRRVSRFDMALMFLSKSDKAVIKQLFSHLRSSLSTATSYSQDALDTLAKGYRLTEY